MAPVYRKLISIVSFNDDTGILKIQTLSLSPKVASDIFSTFQNPDQPYVTPEYEFNGCDILGLASKIRIDTRSGDGKENAVIELKSGFGFEGAAYQVLDSEGTIRVEYSSEGQELSRYLQHGARVPRADLIRQGPAVSAADVTELLQAVMAYGRQEKDARYSHEEMTRDLEERLVDFSPLTQELYEINIDGHANNGERSDRCFKSPNPHARVTSFVTTPQQLVKDFPFLTKIRPVTAQAVRPGMAANTPACAL